MGVDAVCTHTDRELLDVIESLYDQALLRRVEDDPTGLPRYSMLSSIRAFALEQLSESGDEQQLREQHAAWFLGMAETLEPNLVGSGQQQAIERLNRSMPNLRRALDDLIDRGDQEFALRLATALSRDRLILLPVGGIESHLRHHLRPGRHPAHSYLGCGASGRRDDRGDDD